MTKSDLIESLTSAIRTTADKVGITDVDWKIPEDLLKEIREINPQVYSLLQEYFDAYLQCYLTWSQENITIRNNARMAILVELNKL